MAKGKRLVTWSIRVDDELDAVVKRLAEKDLRTVSNYIEMVVRKHIVDLGITVDESAEPKAKKPAKKGGKA
jgi:predicted transcriptional regulator